MSKSIVSGVIGSWLILATAVLPVRAAEAKAPQPYVVVVGISNYADKQIQPRPHAEDDAKALYDLLTDKRYLGADAEHAKLLLGSDDARRKGQRATRENIIKSLHWLAENARPEDPVFFAFLGQGGTLTEQGDRHCYFAEDSTVQDRAKNAVAAADVAQELDKLKSQRFCAFVDVTFKGFTVGKEPAPEPNWENLTFKEFVGSEGKEEKGPAPGRALFLASYGRLQSPDLDKNGLFTYVTVKGLQGAADKEGYEPDGLVTVDELTEYVDKEVPEVARQQIKNKDERPLPAVFGGRSSHFALTTNPDAQAKVKERLDKFAELVKDKKVTDKEAEEGRDVLGRMPRLKAQQSVRKAYQDLVDGRLTLEQFRKERESIVDRTKLKRTKAIEFAAKIIEATQILSKNYVKEVNQGELVGWAIRGLYRRADEKIPQETQARLDKIKEMKEGELTVLLADVREGLGTREDLADHKDVDVALQQMMRHLDPYTTYIDPETKQRVDQEIRGRFTGIGIQIERDANRDMLRVKSPILGSPAYKKGVKAGDVITQITSLVDKDGKPLAEPETISTKGLLMSDAVKRILGKEGTDVRITVEREGADKPIDFTITRARVDTESVLGVQRKADDGWDYLVDPQSKIAYVRLTSFQDNTAEDLKKVMADLKKEKIKGMVLDLRFNPGGLLSSAVRISDMFIADGIIVKIRERGVPEKRYSGMVEGSHLDFPMVVLVNGESASGSEIVAACLQDWRRAVVVGERSYGKGSVQNIMDFEGGEIKLTTATFWRPSDRNLNKSSTAGRDDEDWGVVPDKGFEVKLSRKEMEDLREHQAESTVIPRRDRPVKTAKSDFKDRQLDKALDYLRDQIKMASRVPAK